MLSRSYGKKNTNRGILIKIVTSLSKVNCFQTIATDEWAQWWLQLVNKETDYCLSSLVQLSCPQPIIAVILTIQYGSSIYWVTVIGICETSYNGLYTTIMHCKISIASCRSCMHVSVVWSTVQLLYSKLCLFSYCYSVTLKLAIAIACINLPTWSQKAQK